MAIFVGIITCDICGKEIPTNELFYVPVIAAEPDDSLFFINEKKFHRACLSLHPKFEQVQDRLEKISREMDPVKRVCIVTGERITDPDDYFSTGFLTESRRKSLFPFNFLHIKKSELMNWDKLSQLGSALKAAINNCPNTYFERLLTEIIEAGWKHGAEDW